MEVILASSVLAGMSSVELEQGPKMSTLYPVIHPFLLSFEGGFQESFAVASSLQLLLIVNSQGLSMGAESGT